MSDALGEKAPEARLNIVQNESMARLGDKVTDPITGYSGVVVSRTEYAFGVIHLGVQAPMLNREGRPLPPEYFDERQVQTEASLTPEAGSASPLPTSAPQYVVTSQVGPVYATQLTQVGLKTPKVQIFVQNATNLPADELAVIDRALWALAEVLNGGIAGASLKTDADQPA